MNSSANIGVVGASFAAYTLAIIGVGLLAARRGRGEGDDYFLGRRTLGPWLTALSASASAESGWVTLGLVGAAFTYGYQSYWIIPGTVLGFLFDWFFMAGRLGRRSRDLDAVTIPDLLAFHFKERWPILRIMAVAIIMIAMMAYVAGQLAAAGKAFEATFDMPYAWGVLLGAGIVLAYTVVGGFRAVCWTDYAQAAVMVTALVAFPIYILASSGGFEFVNAALAGAADPPRGIEPGDLLRWIPSMTGWGLVGFFLGSRALGINFGYPGQPHVLVRFMAMKDPSLAWKAGAISGVWTTLVFWGAITTGLCVRAFHETGAPWAAELGAGSRSEAGLVTAALHLLPGVAAGFVVAAVLSAICSTADSQILVAASAAANDVYARIFRGNRPGGGAWVNRITVLALGIGAVLLVIDQRVSVYGYILTYAWAILGASFGPQLIVLLWWPGARYAGCIAGMVTGFAVAVAWPHFYVSDPGSVEVYNLTAAFFAALFVNVAVCLAVNARRHP